MTNTITLEPALRSVARERRGSVLGVVALVFSLFSAFWAAILWIIVAASDGQFVGTLLFSLAGVVGVVFLALTAVFATMAIMRNATVGLVSAIVAAAVGAGALVAGLLAAVQL
jgi:hypothetical protein